MEAFFTIPDPDLTQESSVDPMGIQPIWTYYGQAIFNSRITTIANDLRIFTLNLYHNHVLNLLYKEYIEELQDAKSYYKTWQTEYDVKSGILMFLEDLVTWTFFLHNQDSEVAIDKLGILGLNKARNVYNTKNGNEDEIFLAASKRSGLLKNQINLGMTGRYKGPMMNMEFFDRSLTYLPKTWEHIERFMQKWVDAMELEKSIVKLIIKILSDRNKKDFPQLTLYDIKNSGLWRPVTRGYLKCFGKRRLPRDIRLYWQDKLGMRNGAAKALFEQMGELSDDEYINHQTVFIKAKRDLKDEPNEMEKVENIIKIEPFLSHSEYLLRYIAQPSVKNVDDVRGDLEILRGQIKSAGSFSINKPYERLTELLKIMLTDGSLEEWLKRILDYHNKIMTQRGGNMWVSLEDQGNFKHYFGGPIKEDINTVSKYLKSKVWLHTYYLETLRSIHAGMN